jgi:Cu-Zn family superoxide dismutase
MFPSANRASTEYVRNREEKILRKRRAGLLVLFGVLPLTIGAGIALAQGGGMASAQLEDADGNPVGEATFTEGPNGITINANLQPGQDAAGPGAHGVHIHETGETSPDFEAAGEHFNPSGAQHGLENPAGPHEGDLEEIVVNEDGSAYYQTLTDRITLSGENAILDSDGSALVIHAGSDDQETDPGGNSGGRAVAGVIRLAQSGEATTPESTTPAGKKDLPKSGGADVLLPAALGAISVVILGGGVLIRHLRRRS